MLCGVLFCRGVCRGEDEVKYIFLPRDASRVNKPAADESAGDGMFARSANQKG